MKILAVILLVALLVALLAIPMVAGVTRQEQGPRVVFTFGWWAVVSQLAGSGLALGLWWWFRKRLVVGLKLGLLALGMGLPLIHLPSMFQGYVLVDDDHFEGCYGAFGSFTRPNVHFAGLREIRQIISVNADGDSRTAELLLAPREGQLIQLQISYVLIEPAVPDILLRARNRQVSIVVEQRRN